MVTIDGENVRCALVRLMTAVQARMLADKSDDTKCFEALIQVLRRNSDVTVLKFERRLKHRILETIAFVSSCIEYRESLQKS